MTMKPSNTMTTKSKKHEVTLPPLTRLQFAVLDALGASQITGRDLRARLKENGINKSGPAFYQMMARLEEAKYVEGWYTQEIIDGQIIKQRHYRMMSDGVRAVNETRKFYQSSTVGIPATA